MRAVIVALLILTASCNSHVPEVTNMSVADSLALERKIDSVEHAIYHPKPDTNTVVVKTYGFSNVTEYEYEHALREAIRLSTAQDISFCMEAPRYSQIEPPIYQRKYRVKVNNSVYTFAYAKVRYHGGDPKDLRNWETEEAFVDLKNLN